MKFLKLLGKALASRYLTPVVVGVFFLVYIGIAFFTDETLIALMGFTQKNLLLAGLLALIPLNFLMRLVLECAREIKRRRALKLAGAVDPSGLFDESVEVRAGEIPDDLERRLSAAGYAARRGPRALAAWRGVGLFPARLCFLAACFFLFAGVLISTTSKGVYRAMVIEGENFPANGTPVPVTAIRLARGTGAILDRTLSIDVAPDEQGGATRSFQLYPPSLFRGGFVYPRYLGLAVTVRFTAPDLPGTFENRANLNLFPPGKLGSVPVGDSPYRVDLTLPVLAEGGDRYGSYSSEQRTFEVKLLKGKELLFSGSVPSGGVLQRDGYRIEILEARRLVVTDVVADYGVYCIWAALLLYLVAVLTYLPVRVLFPRREMLFLAGDNGASGSAQSRAEGRRSGHAGTFHDALDLLETRGGTPPTAG